MLFTSSISRGVHSISPPKTLLKTTLEHFFASLCSPGVVFPDDRHHVLVDRLLALVLLLQLVDLWLLQLSGLVPEGLPCQILDQIVHLFRHYVPVDPFDQQSFALVLCLPLCYGLTEVCNADMSNSKIR